MNTRSKMYVEKKRAAMVAGDQPGLSDQIQFPVKPQTEVNRSVDLPIDELRSDGSGGAFGATEAVQE